VQVKLAPGLKAARSDSSIDDKLDDNLNLDLVQDTLAAG
jgi:hypothetical protein